MKSIKLVFITTVVFLFAFSSLYSQETNSAEIAEDKSAPTGINKEIETAASEHETENQSSQETSGSQRADKKSKKVDFSYGTKGWQMEYDNKFRMSLEWRLQFRGVLDSDPDENTFSVQRARMKVDGYAFRPWMEYFLEFDFPTLSLLNFEFTMKRLEWLQFKLGQWKVEYNTERFISSGKQEFVDRTIANKYFTYDRQIGIMLKGNLFEGTSGCFTYAFGMFNGDGRMQQNLNSKFMYLGRLQWNFSGKVMKMSFADLERVRKPEGFIAFSGVTNRSAFTRFSTSGGGQLPGYENPLNNSGPVDYNRFLINQLGFEVMLKYRGLTFMSENHIKSIEDDNPSASHKHSLLYGGYVSAGFFPGEFIRFMPDPFEMVLRYSLVSNDELYNYNINEYGVAFNWYFSGHRNKITLDVSYLQNDDFKAAYNHIRSRLQWDVSF